MAQFARRRRRYPVPLFKVPGGLLQLLGRAGHDPLKRRCACSF